MSESKHTPGPWSACKNGECECGFIWDASGEVHVASVHDVSAIGKDWYGADMAVKPPMRAANARLIAAAPDLLEAAKFALPALEDEASMRKLTDPIRVAAYVMRTAIAKAEGSATRSAE